MMHSSEVSVTAVGTLRGRMGPMYAKKSLWLNGEATTQADLGAAVLKISPLLERAPETDLVVDDAGSTHHSSYGKLTDKIARVRVARLVDADIKGINCIAVDEAQFFPDLVETVRYWVEDLGLQVLVAGLDADFAKQPFLNVLSLIPLAPRDFKKLSNHCIFCIRQLRKIGYKGDLSQIAGGFSKRMSNNMEPVDVKSVHLPACRPHHAINFEELEKI